MSNKENSEGNIHLLIAKIDWDVVFFSLCFVVLVICLLGWFMWSDWINYQEALAGICRDSVNGDFMHCLQEGTVDININVVE